MNIRRITVKNVKATEHNHAHTNVYVDNTHVGYFMKNTSKYARINENWNFVPNGMGILEYRLYAFYTSSRYTMIQTLKKKVEENENA